MKKYFMTGRKINILIVLPTLFFAFNYIVSPPPGIDNPEPIGSYLNGAFPDSAPSGSSQNWKVENAFPHITFVDPMAMLEIPGTDSSYVIGKSGTVWQISNDSSTTTKNVVLDISIMVDVDNDAGVLNGVLHPDFGKQSSPNRGYLYLFYRWNPIGDVADCTTPGFLRVSRFNRPDGTTNFDPSSEYILVQTYDEHCWHNGGAMFFDQEGYFYYTVGDAGGINDSFNVTQKIDERLISGLFRIDLNMDPSRSHAIRRQQVDPVDRIYSNDSSFSQGYFIPNDNPFLDINGGILEEYYALGLRNPHRATLDSLTGNIWIGDVGKGDREEVSVVDQPGLNFQWPFREGNIQGDGAVPNPIIGISTAPVYDYTHTEGNSIIGGLVYRGEAYHGALNGKYIFGDHGVRNIWSYNLTNGEVVFLANVPPSGQGDKNGISSFATNSSGDLFVLKLYGTELDGGIIYRLTEDISVPEPPQYLSLTGAFSDLNDLTPASGLVPYTVNAPLWSDRAIKKRWIALPNDGNHDSPEEQIIFIDNGNWQFPPGTVLIKHFDLPIDYTDSTLLKRIETRFLVIIEDGAYGVTYKWNDQGTDAELISSAESQDYMVTLPGEVPGIQTWDFPSRSNCMTCHNANADFVLGVHTWQLNGDYTYPISGITDNQLNTWHHLGMFANPFDPMDISGFIQSTNISDQNASLESRVRSYLDANCSHCHRPNGVTGAFDATFTTPLENQNLLWIYGISPNTSKIHYMIKPLDTSESEIWIRDKNLGSGSMPPLAKNLVDSAYIDVLTDWINSLTTEACEEMKVSSMPWLDATNGQGQIEIDRSVNTEQPYDGNLLTINGKVFPHGLGVHAHSEITFAVNKDFSMFKSYIGIDDETCALGSCQFEVYVDNILAYQSPILTQADDPLLIMVNIENAQEVKLVTTDGGNGLYCDHGDWAEPLFLPCLSCSPGASCNDGDSCTVNDHYNEDCNCVGTFIDSDFDGIADTCDICPGHDDMLDTDSDGIPDGCDECVGMQASICPSGDCMQDDDAIPSGVHAAFIRLSSAGNVLPDSTVIFQSAQQIDLNQGFNVASGASFEANIVDCENGSNQGNLSDLSPFLSMSDLPNNRGIAVKYQVEMEGEISIQILDRNGNLRLLPQKTSPKKKGLHQIQIGTRLQDGLYFLKVIDKNVTSINKFLVLDGHLTDQRETVVQNEQKRLHVSEIPSNFSESFHFRIHAPIPEMKRAKIRISDVSGRVIFQKYDAEFEKEIEIRSFPGWSGGTYFIQIVASEYSFETSIVKH